MPEASPNHLASSLNHNQRELLERRYPRAGYWFNTLPTHPFIHGVNASPSMVPRTRVPWRLNDPVPPLLDTPLHGAMGECTRHISGVRSTQASRYCDSKIVDFKWHIR